MRKPMGERFTDSLPHLGAVMVSLVSYFVLLVPLDTQDDGSRFVGFVVFLVLLASPVIGSLLVLRVQGRPGSFRSVIVTPYVRWFVVGLAAMLILSLEGVFPFFNEHGVGVVLTSGAFLALIVVPFLIPTLRFLMWLISPPTDLKVSQTSV
jgi:hypothetical protein